MTSTILIGGKEYKSTYSFNFVKFMQWVEEYGAKIANVYGDAINDLDLKTIDSVWYYVRVEARTSDGRPSFYLNRVSEEGD